MSRILSFLSVLAYVIFSTVSASAFQSAAKSVVVLDALSDTILVEKNADTPIPPASMSKLMTLYMVFEALKSGRLSLQDRLPVSKEAIAYRGSTMFLELSDRVSVEDLIRGVVVLSGNDASAVLAEALSPDGTEAGFAAQMNARARELGLDSSNFANSNGWPHPLHRMSARDLAILAARLISDFPIYYRYFAETEFDFEGRAPGNRFNRNPLLKLNIGVDGLKTGYTREAGYGLTGSAKRDKRRVIFVLAGLSSAEERARESEKLVNWYFLQFATRTLFEDDEVILEVPVFMGSKSTVSAISPRGVHVSVPLTGRGEITAEAVLYNGIEAPISKGQILGELLVKVPSISDLSRFPLQATEDIERGGIGTRIWTAAKLLFQKYVLDALK
ncbi:MAG: D-alanyl-D-alanine carboxypeptidase [Albidovulum sp.]|nr:D-alanyl-D-alanine carboxypeptidase [Albidovulum sp.]MDE0306553.1 D-alanyl-D-alanine carboxypeptidase [Albidovulum sp.]MDE0533341.1 D-alanyl-D-alanine carboxypeptidase [Albidovulum sp.]